MLICGASKPHITYHFNIRYPPRLLRLIRLLQIQSDLQPQISYLVMQSSLRFHPSNVEVLQHMLRQKNVAALVLACDLELRPLNNPVRKESPITIIHQRIDDVLMVVWLILAAEVRQLDELSFELAVDLLVEAHLELLQEVLEDEGVLVFELLIWFERVDGKALELSVHL